MKRSRHLVQLSKFPSNRLLASLALILALLRHYHFLRSRFSKVIASIQRAFRIARLFGLALSHTSEDILTYLQPTLAQRLHPRSYSRTNSFSSSSRGRLHSQHISSVPSSPFNSTPPSPANSQTQVPRSLRRILRLISSPDGLVILHNIAGGLARGVTREFREQQQQGQNDTNTSSSTNLHNEDKSNHQITLLLQILSSSSGQNVISNVVSTGVKEAVTSFLQFQQANARHEQVALPQLITDAVLSDRGRKLIVEVANGITRTAVPLLLQQQPSSHQEHDQNAQKPDLQVTTVHAIPSTSTMSPVASPLVKRPLSFTGHSRLASPVTQNNNMTPVTRHLVNSIMQAQGRTGLIERLALLAIRDKELVREIVRTVVGEAVRTYLTTKSALQGESDLGANTSDSEISSSSTTTCKNYDSNGSVASETVPKSLWKVLIKSALIDFKRELITRGSAHPQSGWLIF